MSSSPTETFVDVTMPQMGVSVAEGTVVEWKKQPGDWVERRRDHRLDLDRQDRHRRRGAGDRPRAGDPGRGRHDGRRRRRDGADRHRREAGRGARLGERSRRARAPRGRGRARGAGRGRRAVRRHDREHAGTAQRGTPEVRRSGPRRYSPVVMRIAAEHGIDLEQVEGTGRGGRVRKQTCSRTSEAARKSRRCTSRARTADEPRPRAEPRTASRRSAPRQPRPRPRAGGAAALAHAPVDRQAR